MPAPFTLWDWALVAVVSIHATTLAYLHHPRWKAFALTLPVPFTFAALSIGANVDVTNIAGLILLMLYTHGVRLLHVNLRMPIVPAIVLSAAGYCVLGTRLVAVLPRTELAFWLATAATFVMALILDRWMSHRHEPGHRSPLPVWIKLPIIAAVIIFLVIIKKSLQGFMTSFPMVGVIAAYEARHCLWTISRQIPLIMVTLLVMMVMVHLVTPYAGLGWALAAGWVSFLAVLTPLTLVRWAAESEPA